MKGRWTTVLLIASLALNLFLLGAGAGVIALSARMAHPRAAARPASVLRAAATVLTPQDRRAFVATLRQNARALRPTTLEARDLKRQVWASLGDPKFDPAAAKAKLARARGFDQAARTAIEEAVIDFAAKLPPGERARFGAAVAQAIPAGQPPRK